MAQNIWPIYCKWPCLRINFVSLEFRKMFLSTHLCNSLHILSTLFTMASATVCPSPYRSNSIYSELGLWRWVRWRALTHVVVVLLVLHQQQPASETMFYYEFIVQTSQFIRQILTLKNVKAGPLDLSFWSFLIYIYKTVMFDRVFALYRPCAYPGAGLRHVLPDWSPKKVMVLRWSNRPSRDHRNHAAPQRKPNPASQKSHLTKTLLWTCKLFRKSDSFSQTFYSWVGLSYFEGLSGKKFRNPTVHAYRSYRKESVHTASKQSEW